MAKSQNEAEIDQVIADCTEFLSSELTQVAFNEKALQLHFKLPSSYCWLTFSMKPGFPYFFLSSQRIFLVKNLKKPLNLFLKTHFVGLRLKEVLRDEQFGRVVQLVFDDQTQIELNFIPGQVNVTAILERKKVSAFKPKTLRPKSVISNFDPGEIRKSSYFEQLWFKQNDKKNNDKKVSTDKILKKKLAGLEKMQEKLKLLEDSSWQHAGAQIKTLSDWTDLEPQWHPFVDQTKSLSWNIENCFAQAKKNTAKKRGTLLRINELKKEIASLESGQSLKVSAQKPESLLSQAQIKGRTISLPAGRLFIGRSGAENLKLLRKAKPWYLWLHIKDYPGAHGIVELTNKQGKIDDKSLSLACEAVIHQSLPKGHRGLFEVIYCQCRYVRPIKGAKSGQVTYSHEKVISIRVNE